MPSERQKGVGHMGLKASNAKRKKSVKKFVPIPLETTGLGFEIIPSNRKLLKSAKVREYLRYAEQEVAEMLLINTALLTGISLTNLPPKSSWFSLQKDMHQKKQKMTRKGSTKTGLKM